MKQYMHRAMLFIVLGITCFLWKSYTISVAFVIVGINLIYGALFHQKIKFHSVALLEIALAIIIIVLGLFLPKPSMYLISIYYIFTSPLTVINQIKMKIFKIKNNLEPILSFLLGASIIINVNGTFNFMYYITGTLLILLGIHTFIFEKNDDDEDDNDEIDFPFE